jgi:V8-like Glu-specific endopeptidase
LSAGTFVCACAGSLIAPDVVLTARHCVLPRAPSPGSAARSSSSCTSVPSPQRSAYAWVTRA